MELTQLKEKHNQEQDEFLVAAIRALFPWHQGIGKSVVDDAIHGGYSVGGHSYNHLKPEISLRNGKLYSQQNQFESIEEITNEGHKATILSRSIVTYVYFFGHGWQQLDSSSFQVQTINLLLSDSQKREVERQTKQFAELLKRQVREREYIDAQQMINELNQIQQRLSMRLTLISFGY